MDWCMHAWALLTVIVSFLLIDFLPSLNFYSLFCPPHSLPLPLHKPCLTYIHTFIQPYIVISGMFQPSRYNNLTIQNYIIVIIIIIIIPILSFTLIIPIHPSTPSNTLLPYTLLTLPTSTQFNLLSKKTTHNESYSIFRVTIHRVKIG